MLEAKLRSKMAAFGLFGWHFSFEEGDMRDVVLFRKLFGGFFTITFVYSTMKLQIMLETTQNDSC